MVLKVGACKESVCIGVSVCVSVSLLLSLSLCVSLCFFVCLCLTVCLCVHLYVPVCACVYRSKPERGDAKNEIVSKTVAHVLNVGAL